MIVPSLLPSLLVSCAVTAPEDPAAGGVSSLGAASDHAEYLESDGTDGTARGRRGWTVEREASDDEVVKRGAATTETVTETETETAIETGAALRDAAAAPVDQRVQVSVRLREPAGAALDLHDVDAADREGRWGRLADYHARLAPSQDAFAARLAALGGRELNRHYLTNHVLVELPAARVAALVALPDVVGISRTATMTPLGIVPIRTPPNLPSNPTGYNGQDVRTALHLNTPIAHGTTGAGVSIGIADCGPIPQHHWNNNGRYTDWYCPATGCLQASCVTNGQPDVTNPSCAPAVLVSGVWVPVTFPNWSGDATSHGSYVADLAGGSVEHGEDPSLHTVLDEVARSGVAPGAHVDLYWGPDGTASLAAAVTQSTLNGDSVLNNSCGHGCAVGSGSSATPISCPTTDDYSGVNEDLQAANAAGEMTAVATGDGGGAIGYPATRPETLGVGWADSPPGSNPDVAGHYPDSGVGPLSFGVYQEGTAREAAVGLIAPGQINLMASATVSSGDKIWPSGTYAPDGYLGPGCGAGASFSAPIVAGTTALMTQAYRAEGWHPNGLGMMAAMLATGDGYTEAGSTELSGVSATTGYGHVHMHYPSSDGNLTAPWSWGNDSFAIATGQDHYIQLGVLPATVTELKFALVWNETDMTAAADIDVYAEWLGSGNCNAAPVTIASQDDLDLHQRLELKGSQIAGQCIRLRVHGYRVPAAGRTVYAVNFWHSGTD
jgi:hypothetical protein|nr:S8 family serine peptidase [Kofleriaceae bacterium]